MIDHLPALDGLRGLAILLVIAHNLATVPLPAAGVGHLVEFALDLGWIGVQLFFVLSGFLITRILMQTQGAPRHFRAFFARRVLRIFPLYYGALFIAFVLVPMVGTPSSAVAHDQPHQQWLWLYMSNWAATFGVEIRAFPHFWSLAIEEQFYLVWPFLIYRLRPAQVAALCLGVAALSLGVRVFLLMGGTPHEVVYTSTFCRMDALALGALVAASLQMPSLAQRFAPHGNRFALGSLLLGLAGVVVTHGYPRTETIDQTLGYTWLAVVFALGVMAIALAEGRADSAWQRVLRSPVLRTFGLYSYAMYVMHKPLHDNVGRPLLAHLGLLDRPSIVVAIAYVAVGALASLVLAMVSYHLFEKHFLALKRYFVAQPVPAAPVNPR